MLQRNPEMPLVRENLPRKAARALNQTKAPGLWLFKLIGQWLATRRDRVALLRLSDEHLKDIGLSRSMIDHAIITQDYRNKSGNPDWMTRR